MDSTVIAVFVPGRPAPQGSKRARPIYRGRGENREFTGKVAQQESSKALKPWREDIRQAILNDHLAASTDAMSVRLHFVMPRPKYAPKRSTPRAIKRPDVDKLVRGVLDAIGSAGVWVDDSQVVELHATKRIAEPGETPGCMIYIHPFDANLAHIPDWRQVAVRLVLAGGCAFHKLSTMERDALEVAVAHARDGAWLDAEVRAERAADAASGQDGPR